MPDEQVATPSVDVAAIQAEIAKLSPTALAEQLTKVRVRQKVQQKRQYAKGAMKTYQLKQREKFKSMKEVALNTPATEVNPATGRPFANLWEQINAAAEAQAEALLEESAVVSDEEVGEES
jgi:hypothetical protein